MSLPEIVSEVISSLTKGEREDTREATPYDGKRERGITVREYLERWQKYAHEDMEVILIAMIYLDRCCVKTKMQVTKRNVHRLLLACLVVGSKWVNDKPFTNTHYAAVGGVTVADLNTIERQLITDISFSLHVEPRQLKVYKKEFMRNAKSPGSSPRRRQ
eukprot:TRINITY_DN2231_c4_g1_i1.p1 TRINITY_DN2231_c4_g1~~TRINITY_DN2231_c4_g1_i1.p1  ORF type:complete len:160 (+),score=16.48 TRINITY_DN2231_c4_g1_i1:71-550(+)